MNKPIKEIEIDAMKMKIATAKGRNKTGIIYNKMCDFVVNRL